MVATRDGSTLYIAHFDAGEVAVMEVAQGKIVRTIPVGKQPGGIVLSPDEKTLYVVSGGDRGRVLAIDAASGNVLREAPAGHTPCGPAVTPDGKKLFVCNRFHTDVAEYDLPDLTLVRRIKAVREPRGAVVTGDGKKVYILNGLPNDPTNDPENPDAAIHVAAAVTVIDVASGTTTNIRLPNGSGSLLGICLSPDRRYVYATGILARFQMPTTQVERGWMNTNGIHILDATKLDDPRGAFVNTVLLDDVDKGAANPWGIATSADGKRIFVAVAGTSELIVVDAEAMHRKLDAVPPDDAPDVAEGPGSARSVTFRASDVPNDLAFLVGMKTRIELDGKGARAVAVVGNDAYVGMYFSDTLQKVDPTAPGKPRSAGIPVGPKPVWTRRRQGEIHWNDATLCFQLWQSCASCHPDARMDAYNWDLLNDGMGNPKNTKSLIWCDRCPPAMWEGVRAGSQVCTRTGFKHILFFEPGEEACRKIDDFVHGLEPLPSPHLVDGRLSERAERGRKIFEDPKVGCVQCHPAPLFTDQKTHDVNTKCYYDRKASFDTPSLVEVWRTAPYLHDGRYVDMKDVFKIGRHGDVAGDIESLTDEQLDDLVEYILSL